MLGPLIKKHRLDKNLSQESLSQGICSVSYLSKIETGQTEASYEILSLLLHRLDIPMPETIEALEEIRGKIQQGIKALLFSDHEHKNRIRKDLENMKELLSSSPLAVDWHIFQGYLAMENHDLGDIRKSLSSLETYFSYFTENQRYHYYVLKGLFEIEEVRFSSALEAFKKAQSTKRDGNILSHIAITSFYLGDYVTTISLGREAYQLLMEEGNLQQGIQLSIIIAAAYSNKGQIEESLTVYRRLIHLTLHHDQEKIRYTVYYNLGATYLVEKQYLLAKENLNKAKNLLESKRVWQRMILYQKLVLCSVGLQDLGAAREYLEELGELKKTSFPQASSSLMLSIEWLMLYLKDEDPKGRVEYLEGIKKTYEASKKDSHFGFQLFYGEFLIEAYRLQRKYKEALLVSDELRRR